MEITLKEEDSGNNKSQFAVVNGRFNRQEQLVEWRKEFEQYYQRIMKLSSLTDTEIFETIASISARVSFIRSVVARSEQTAMNNFRTKEIDPLLNELQFQFKVWSRALSVKSLELDMSK